MPRRDHPAAAGPLDTEKSVAQASPALALDESALFSFLRSHVSSFPSDVGQEQLRVLKFTHGQSNPTYLLQVRQSCGNERKKRGNWKREKESQSIDL